MSHFLLYLPGATGQGPSVLEDVGLADFHAGAEWLDLGIGPDEGRGMLVAWRKPGTPHRLHFNITEQTWIPANRDGDLPAGRYWIGFWNDAPPTPADLARPYQRKGRTHELADGQTWLFAEPGALPADLIQADDGTWKYELQRKYHAWYLESLSWLDRIDPATEVFRSSLEEMLPFLARALAINYRITPEVISHLRLFNTENVGEPFYTLIGAQTLREKFGTTAHV